MITATTKSGTRYRFEFVADSPDPFQRPWGKVRKDDEPWQECLLLTGEITVGHRMVMALDPTRDSDQAAVRHTTHVTQISTT